MSVVTVNNISGVPETGGGAEPDGDGTTKLAMTGGNLALPNDVKTAVTGLVASLEVGRWELAFHLSHKNVPYWAYLDWTGTNTACVVYPVWYSDLTGPATEAPADGDFMTQIDRGSGDTVGGCVLRFDITVTVAGDYTLSLHKKGAGDGVLYGARSYLSIKEIAF